MHIDHIRAQLRLDGLSIEEQHLVRYGWGYTQRFNGEHEPDGVGSRAIWGKDDTCAMRIMRGHLAVYGSPAHVEGDPIFGPGRATGLDMRAALRTVLNAPSLETVHQGRCFRPLDIVDDLDRWQITSFHLCQNWYCESLTHVRALVFHSSNAPLAGQTMKYETGTMWSPRSRDIKAKNYGKYEQAASNRRWARMGLSLQQLEALKHVWRTETEHMDRFCANWPPTTLSTNSLIAAHMRHISPMLDVERPLYDLIEVRRQLEVVHSKRRATTGVNHYEYILTHGYRQWHQKVGKATAWKWRQHFEEAGITGLQRVCRDNVHPIDAKQPMSIERWKDIAYLNQHGRWPTGQETVGGVIVPTGNALREPRSHGARHR